MKVAAYSIEQIGDCVGIKRHLSVTDSVMVETFDEAVSFLTQKQSNTVCFVWNLEQFTKGLFSLLPMETLSKLKESNRVFYEDIKIYYVVGRMLGLGRQDFTKRISDKAENNFYPLNSWLSESRNEPESVKELADLGNQVLDAIHTLGLEPTKLTSPAGLYASKLIGKVPTVTTNPKLLEISNFILPALNLEWVKDYNPESFAPCYTYDQKSSYPYQMTMLRNTDNCIITKSNTPIPSHYAVVEIDNLQNVPEINPLVNTDRKIYASPELKWLKSHGSTFEIGMGHYIKWLDCKTPYKESAMELFNLKQQGNILGEVCKRTVNGISGKLDQQNSDGTIGELYNPLQALIMRVGARMFDYKFIEDYNLINTLVSVHLDSVTSYTNLNLPKTGNIGEWRQS